MGSIAIGATASASGITINSTTITGGTNKLVLYDNAGTVGEAANFSIDSGNPNIATLGTGQLEIAGIMVMAADPVTGANYFLFGAGGSNTLTGNNNYGFGSSQNRGFQALGNLAGGSNNICIGTGAGNSITNSGDNTIVGHFAGRVLDNSSNVAIGHSALGVDALSSGQNVAIGSNAMAAFSRAGDSSNVAIGFGAMGLATGGSNNVAIGHNALNSNTVAGSNFALGSDALNSNTTGEFSIAIGNNTLPSCNAGHQTAIGRNAGNNITSGDTNTLIGYQTGQGIVSGRANTVIGANVTSLGSGLSNAIIIADSDGNIKLDYNNTGSSKWVMQTAFNLAFVATAGVLVANGSGDVSCDSSVAAATVAANFTADHRLQVTIGATTYYLAASTTAW